MNGPRRTLAATRLGLVVLLMSAGSFPAAADWLVLHDGERIETDGPWTVEGRQVVFTMPGGTLASLRVDDVDLDASEVATAGALESEVGPAEGEARSEGRAPVAVFTNENLGPVSASGRPRATPASDEGEEAERPGTMQATAPFEVLAWRSTPGGNGGLEITGTIQNGGPDQMTLARGTVELRSEDGGVFDRSAQLFFATRTLRPATSTTFRALFTGIDEVVGSPYLDVEVETVPGY